MKKFTLLTIYLSLFLTGSLFAQQTVWVNASASDGANNGLSAADAYTNFADGLAAIDSAGDILRIVGTVSTSGADITSKSFAFTIEGNDATSTIVGDGGTGRLFTINAATSIDVTFKDLTFSGNNTTLAGGGVLFSNDGGATVTFNNCIVTGNSVTNAAGGGAIFFANGTLNITNSTFTSNTSSDEGGAIFGNSGTITITNSVFESNSAATKGGAIYANTANFTITGTTFYDNQTTGTAGPDGGAAFYVVGASSTNSITNCTFFQNTTARASQDYGTIRTDNGNTTVTNSLFYNNKMNNDAGAESDWGSGPNGTQTFNTSIAQLISTNVDNNDEGFVDGDGKLIGSITGIKGGAGTPADLTNSGVAWNATLKRVTFTAPNALTDHSPIDFGSDTSDVGAWDSKINIFKGGTTGAVEAWTTAANWSNGALPLATDNVAILTGRNCTLAGTTNINDIKVTATLKINANQAIIVNGDATVTGTVRHFVQLTDFAGNLNNWHLVGSPVSGEVFDTTFADKNDIASGTGSNRGIASYNPGQIGAAAWTYFTGTDVNATSGQGFSMKITPDGVTAGQFPDNLIGFEGSFNTADVTTESLTAGYNLLGNPYTSYVSSATFLAAGTSSNLDQTQIWVWNQSLPDYEVKTSGSAFVLAPGQGFFVNATSGGTVTFAESNQATTGNTFQKSTATEVNLWMTDGIVKRYATLNYSDNATNGFDYGYEGEVFGGVSSSLSVFTELVADNQGKNYQVQSLPLNEIESTVVPLGVKAEAGKEIVFSTENANLPSGVKVFLEDRENNTFTRLDEANSEYKVTLTQSLNGIGRFYLHTTRGALSTDDIALENISIYATNKTTLRIVGLSQGKSNLKLFNILGKQVLNTSFNSNGVFDVNLPKLTTGVYIVKLESKNGSLNKKIVLE